MSSIRKLHRIFLSSLLAAPAPLALDQSHATGTTPTLAAHLPVNAPSPNLVSSMENLSRRIKSSVEAIEGLQNDNRSARKRLLAQRMPSEEPGRQASLERPRRSNTGGPGPRTTPQPEAEAGTGIDDGAQHAKLALEAMQELHTISSKLVALEELHDEAKEVASREVNALLHTTEPFNFKLESLDAVRTALEAQKKKVTEVENKRAGASTLLHGLDAKLLQFSTQLQEVTQRLKESKQAISQFDLLRARTAESALKISIDRMKELADEIVQQSLSVTAQTMKIYAKLFAFISKHGIIEYKNSFKLPEVEAVIQGYQAQIEMLKTQALNGGNPEALADAFQAQATFAAAKRDIGTAVSRQIVAATRQTAEVQQIEAQKIADDAPTEVAPQAVERPTAIQQPPLPATAGQAQAGRTAFDRWTGTWDAEFQTLQAKEASLANLLRAYTAKFKNLSPETKGTATAPALKSELIGLGEQVSAFYGEVEQFSIRLRATTEATVRALKTRELEANYRTHQRQLEERIATVGSTLSHEQKRLQSLFWVAIVDVVCRIGEAGLEVASRSEFMRHYADRASQRRS